MIDFQGDLTVAKVRELLAGDDSRDAKTLLAKLVAEKNVEDMMLVLADCLLEPVQTRAHRRRDARAAADVYGKLSDRAC